MKWESMDINCFQIKSTVQTYDSRKEQWQYTCLACRHERS